VRDKVSFIEVDGVEWDATTTPYRGGATKTPNSGSLKWNSCLVGPSIEFLIPFGIAPSATGNEQNVNTCTPQLYCQGYASRTRSNDADFGREFGSVGDLIVLDYH
jgi:hypothetical protein